MSSLMSKVLTDMAFDATITVTTGVCIAGGFIAAEKLRTADGRLGKASTAGFFSTATIIGIAGIAIAYKYFGSNR